MKDRNKESLDALFEGLQDHPKKKLTLEAEKTECDFCGKLKICCSTCVTGVYCKTCHENQISWSKEALKAITKAKGK